MSAIRHTLEESASRIATTLLAATLCLTLFALKPSTAHAEDLIVKYDQSQLLRLPGKVSQIIIGNPAIADVAIQSAKLLVVTGKSFGITNIIALDANGHIIQDQRVMVQRDEAKVVNLVKGGERQTYNCSPQCNPMLTIGDDSKYFTRMSTNSKSKISMSEKSASSGTGGGR